jgi:hypothetical protein
MRQFWALFAARNSPHHRPYCAIEHLAWTVFLNNDSPDRLMYFSAFFDASGKERSRQPLAVAGYVAWKEQWLLFEQDWTAALGSVGLPYFHMVEFINRPGHFKGWALAVGGLRFLTY